jgi:putative endonuclease
MKTFYVYMLTNSKLKPIYIGMTNNLERRIYEHKNKTVKGFTSKYYLDRLIYWESCEDVVSTIEREKQLKNWKYDWKLDLAKVTNPLLKDLSLYPTFLDPESSSG